MYSRTPLLLLAIALPFTGCTCEWHASTNKSWSTSGGNNVVVVSDPQADQRERDARIQREREWERERERERNRHPVVTGSGGRIGTGAAPHAGATGTPIQPAIQPAVQPAQPVPTPIGPATGSGSAGTGGIGAAVPPVAQPSPPPVPATPIVPATPVVTPTPAPPPAPVDNSTVDPREINKPTGGPAKAGTSGASVGTQDKKKPGPVRRGPLTKQQ